MFKRIKYKDLEEMNFQNMTVEELRKLKPVLGKLLTKENKKINKALQKGMESTELKAKKQNLCEIEKRWDQALVIKLYEGVAHAD